MREIKKAYVCSIDYDTELGMGSGRANFYNSLEAIRKMQSCTKEGHPDCCGIYEVEVIVTKVIQEQGY